jgi:hypothetical protein
MKISKLWCGLFSTVSAGLSLSAYLAQRGSSFCYSTAIDLINAFLSTDIDLSGLNTTATVPPIIPEPVPVHFGALDFNLGHALSNEFVDTLQKIPATANEACKDLIWEQAAVILLVCASVGGLGIYAYRKFKTQQQTIQMLEQHLEAGYLPINNMVRARSH